MPTRVPSGHPPTAVSRQGAPRHPGRPGWRPLLGALAVVAVLALILHLLYR